NIDDATAAARSHHRIYGSATAQKTRHEIAVDLRHQRGLVGVGDLADRETAGNMDRRPKTIQTFIKLIDFLFFGEIVDLNKLDALVAAQRKTLFLGINDVRHAATRAGFDQSADHHASQRAGATGDDDVLPGKIHVVPFAATGPSQPVNNVSLARDARVSAAPDIRSSSQLRWC